MDVFKSPVYFRKYNFKVSNYYNIAFNSIYTKTNIFKTLEQLRLNYPNYKLLVTGHSLGAAMACMGALMAVLEGNWNSNDVILYTFG